MANWKKLLQFALTKVWLNEENYLSICWGKKHGCIISKTIQKSNYVSYKLENITIKENDSYHLLITGAKVFDYFQLSWIFRAL